jgi:hypothetical protein
MTDKKEDISDGKAALMFVGLIVLSIVMFCAGYKNGACDCDDHSHDKYNFQESTHEGCIGCEPVKKCEE